MFNCRARRASAPIAAAALVLALAACSPSDEADQSAGVVADTTPTPSAQSGDSAQSDASADDRKVAEQKALSAVAEAEEAAMATPVNGDAWSTSFKATASSGTTDEGLVFHDMRVGDHDGFSRVVIEFAGEGVPGVSQSWADKPIEQGRGRVLPVKGSSWLDLMISGTTMPVSDWQSELYYDGAPQVQINTLDVREDGTFEDMTHVVIGMDAVREFQIGFLENPARVVIDVKK